MHVNALNEKQFGPFIQELGAHISGSSVFGPSQKCFLGSVTVGGTGALNELAETRIIEPYTPVFRLISSRSDCKSPESEVCLSNL